MNMGIVIMAKGGGGDDGDGDDGDGDCYDGNGWWWRW